MLTDGAGSGVRRYDYLPFGEKVLAGWNGRTAAMTLAISSLVSRIRDVSLKADLKLGGPQGWQETRKGQGYSFFQGGGGGGGNETQLIRLGAQQSLGSRDR
jgi:hypothetical protein